MSPDAVSRIVAAIIARADNVHADPQGRVTLSFYRPPNVTSTAELSEIIGQVQLALKPR